MVWSQVWGLDSELIFKAPFLACSVRALFWLHVLGSFSDPRIGFSFETGTRTTPGLVSNPEQLFRTTPCMIRKHPRQRWRSSGEVPRVSPWLVLEADALSLTTTKLLLCMDGCDSQVGVECVPSRQDLMRVSKLGYVSLTDLIVTPNSLVPAHFGWTKGSSEAAVANCDNFALRRMTAAERKRTQRRDHQMELRTEEGSPATRMPARHRERGDRCLMERDIR